MDLVGLSVDEKRLASVCDRYGPASLEIFGSVSRGEASASSDVDVLYTLKPGARLGWKIEDLSDELSDLFGRCVDLVSRSSLHAQLCDAVLREAKPLYVA